MPIYSLLFGSLNHGFPTTRLNIIMKRIFILLLCFYTVILSDAQQPDKTRLVQKIDAYLQKIMPQNAPGGAIAIVSGEDVIYKKTFGIMSMEYQLPNTNHTLFNLASVSKHFTAYAILLLEKEGKLNLDDDIHKYLPDLPDYRYKVTIRQLIHHTSGIPSSDNLKLFAGVAFEAPWDAEDEWDIINRYNQLNYRPNNEGNYSNSGYFLLAKIIEKVTGSNFSDYISGNIFRPLGMNESYVYDRPGKVFPGKATGYKKEGHDYIRMNTDGESVYGSTNLYTSLDDITKWMQHMLNPEKGDKSLAKKMFYPSDITNFGDTIYYTYGLNVRKYKGIKIADHGGYAMGFRSQIMYFPDENLAMITMCNNESIDNWDLLTGISDLYFNDRITPVKSKQRKEIKIAENVLKNYTGSYILPDGRKFRFELENDTLLLSIHGKYRYVMHPESEKDFFVKEFNAQCSFEMGSNGKCDEIIWHENNWRPVGYRTEETTGLTEETLKRFAGNYFNDPLDVTYPVVLRNSKLYMVIPKTFQTYFGMKREIPMYHVEKDRFYTEELGLVEFKRDADSNIKGFTIVDFGRVKHITFRKTGRN